MRRSLDDNSKSTMILTAGIPVYGGLTLARIPQKPGASAEDKAKIILVKGAIPGEKIEIIIDEEKRDYSLASVTRVIEPSPDRVEPPCPYFGTCGGCQLQFASYARQVAMKEAVLADTLRRIGKIEVPLAKSLALKDNAFNYRHRAQLKVSGEAIGFYKEKSREIVDIERCPLLIEDVNHGLVRIRTALKHKQGLLKNITGIQISSGNDLLASVQLTAKAKASAKLRYDIASLFFDCGFAGVVVKEGSHTAYFGEEYLSLPLPGLDYTVSPLGFFQGNWQLNESMVGLIKNNLHPLAGRHVLDLYAGAGNFALPLALEAAEVVAVEENPTAIADGQRNLLINKIDNAAFIKSTSEQFGIESAGMFDIVIVDPPRAGLADRLISNLLALAPENIVYISCNPSTLARDLWKLAGEYTIESARMVDLFPQTYHLESVVFLSKA